MIDGPVGPKLDAIPTRGVDAAFSRGGFKDRAPGYPITHSSGQDLALVTAGILHLLKGLGASLCPWLGGALPFDRFVVAETNPTPAMALLVPQQDIASLPSRSSPKYWDGAVVRAKSDWYWRLGAGRYASQVLGDPSIADETNHEGVAALFALSLAAGLAAYGENDRSAVAALGDKEGIYLVPSNIDESWKSDVDRIGIVRGIPHYHSSRVASPPLSLTNLTETLPEVARTTQTLTGGSGHSILVVLNDNGGLNLLANPWLAAVDVPCRLRTRGGPTFTVVAKFSGRDDMFRISPSALTLARQLAFTGDHLSSYSRICVEATIAS